MSLEAANIWRSELSLSAHDGRNVVANYAVV